MENDKQNYDITKLKSFYDIVHNRNRNSLNQRRNFSGNNQSFYLMNRIQDRSLSTRMPIRIPQVPTFHTYQILRKTNVNIKGKSVVFHLMDDNKTLLSAKFKGSKPFIPIEQGGDVHFNNENQEGCILYANKYCTFSLRNKSDHGEEIMSLNFKKYQNDGAVPRRVYIYFFNPKDGLPEKLENKEPDITDDMGFCVDLNTEDAITSIKNCRIEDSNHKPFVFIRKKKKDVLEIEGQTVISPMCLFTLGIGSFLCKK